MAAFLAEQRELRLRAAVPYPLDVPVQPLVPSGEVPSDNKGNEPGFPEQGLAIEPGPQPDQGLAIEPGESPRLQPLPVHRAPLVM